MPYIEATGGGDSGVSVNHYTTNITFNDNTTYHYIAEGKFVYLKIARGSVSTVPVIQVFKKINGNYVAISDALSTVNGTTHIITNESTLETSEIYIKKNSGSTFTSTSIDVMYLT